MAAGGMKYQQPDRRPLGERPIGGNSPASGEGPTEPDPDGRPCWVLIDGRRIPGQVHGWTRRADGGWTALVLAWLPGEDVEPR